MAMETDDASHDLAQFIALTGAGNEEASHFLEMANGNLEDAVNLFLECGGGGGGPPPARPPPAAAPPSSLPPASMPGEVIDADVAAEVAAAAAAAGIDTGPLTSDALMGDGGDDVRAPMRAFEDQIISPEVDRWRLQQQIEADSEAMEARMRWEAADDGEEGREGQPTGQALNKLYTAPEFNDKRPWYEVIAKAKEQSKWVLVNIQQKEVFASHVLNRDVWCEGTIVELVTNNFVFWQRDDKSAEGVQFCSYYNCGHQLPHICVIDPRTGRRVQGWDGRKFIEPHAAAECLFSFMEAFSMERSPVMSPVAGPGVPPGQPPEDRLPSSADVELRGLDDDEDGDAPMDTAAPEAPPAPMPEEPPADAPGVIKVSLRLPSGQRVTRRFLPTDLVERLFEVASALTEKAVDTIDVSQTFPKQSLRDGGGLQATLKDTGVAGSALSVSFRRTDG